MTVTIYQSTKFDYAREQYYAEAGGHTLLRLTCGNLAGEAGGAIKSATARDFEAAPVYPNPEELAAAMRLSVRNLGGRTQDVSIEVDGKGRLFGEVTLPGSRDHLVEALHQLAEEMERNLSRPLDDAHNSGFSDLRELYDNLCHAVGEPVYLSDGVYLGSDGSLFE